MNRRDTSSIAPAAMGGRWITSCLVVAAVALLGGGLQRVSGWAGEDGAEGFSSGRSSDVAGPRSRDSSTVDGQHGELLLARSLESVRDGDLASALLLADRALASNMLGASQRQRALWMMQTWRAALLTGERPSSTRSLIDYRSLLQGNLANEDDVY